MPDLSPASAQLHAIAAGCKAASAGGLKLQMTRGLKAGAKPLIPAVQDAARRQLPHAGGLNEQVASQKVTVAVRTGARNASVYLTTRAPDTSQTDQGFVRKPVFGHRDRWKRQEIPKARGWWSQTLARAGHIVTPRLLQVLDETRAALQAGRF